MEARRRGVALDRRWAVRSVGGDGDKSGEIGKNSDENGEESTAIETPARHRFEEGSEVQSQKRTVTRMKGRMGPNPKKAKQEETGAAGGTEEMVGTQQKKQGGKTSAAGEGSSASSADPVNTPPSRIPFPAFPTSGTARDVVKWSKNCRKIGMILAKDPRNYLPTMRCPKDPYTRDAVQSPMDKEMVLSVAPSIVSVSSIGHDGVKIQQCSGIVIQQWEDKVKTRAIVATCSAVVCKRGKLLDPKPKLSIGLPDSTILEGELVFFNDHYDLALVEIQVPVPLLLPSIGSCPQYGMKVLALARDEESTLMARLGEVKYLEESNYLGRNYYVFLNGEIPEKGTGGPVVDYNGSVRGMAFSCSPYPAVLSISTIITCCKMWSNFGHIARPLHGLGVRTIQLLELSLHDRLRRDYGIDTGFIVDKVSYGSPAEALGIRDGDVICSFDDQHVHAPSLPQLEDYFLSLGWAFLQNSSYTVDLKLRVIDLIGCSGKGITLPVRFCDQSERVSSARMTP